MDTLQRENEQNGMDLRQIIRFFLARFWIILFAMEVTSAHHSYYYSTTKPEPCKPKSQ